MDLKLVERLQEEVTPRHDWSFLDERYSMGITWNGFDDIKYSLTRRQTQEVITLLKRTDISALPKAISTFIRSNGIKSKGKAGDNTDLDFYLDLDDKENGKASVIDTLEWYKRNIK